jgi:hypothetical protein
MIATSIPRATVEGHRRGVAAGAARNHLAADPLSPGLELLDCGGAKGVSGAEDHAVALRLVAGGQLPDRRGLSGPVDAEHEDHVRVRADGQAAGALDPLQLLVDRVVQDAPHGLGVSARGLLADPLEQALRRAHSKVGAEQQHLELVDPLGVESATGEQRSQPPDQRIAGAAQAIAQPNRGRRDRDGLRRDGRLGHQLRLRRNCRFRGGRGCRGVSARGSRTLGRDFPLRGLGRHQRRRRDAVLPAESTEERRDEDRDERDRATDDEQEQRILRRPRAEGVKERDFHGARNIPSPAHVPRPRSRRRA